MNKSIPTERVEDPKLVEAYDKLKDTVAEVARQFAARFRQNVDDCFSDANFHFIQGVRSYDATKGTTLKTWVGGYIWKKMLGALTGKPKSKALNPVQLRLMRDRGHGDGGRPGDNTPTNLQYQEPTPFDPKDLEPHLTSHAQFLMDVVLNTPAKLLEELRSMKRPIPKHVRIRLRKYLREEAGFTLGQVRKAFKSIREALAKSA